MVVARVNFENVYLVDFDRPIFEIRQLESTLIKQTDFGKKIECRFANFRHPIL